MNSQRIEALIKKYERGETTLEEELELKIFFATENVPIHLAGYRDLFSFYRKAAGEKMPDVQFDDRVLGIISGESPKEDVPARSRALYPVIMAAASFLVLLGLYMFLGDRSRSRDTFEDPALAYAETRKILLQVSDNLNEGVEELSSMKEINEGLDDLGNISTFNEGMKNMKKISVLDKSKDMITQKNNKQ